MDEKQDGEVRKNYIERKAHPTERHTQQCFQWWSIGEAGFLLVRDSKTSGNKTFSIPREGNWAPRREPLTTGPLVGASPDLGRMSVELSQLPEHLAGGDIKARTELVSETLQGLTNYNRT